MAQQAQRMQTLVNDLLTLSRLEGSPLPGRGRLDDAGRLAGAVRAGGAALAAALGKKLDLRFAPRRGGGGRRRAGELQSACPTW
jgi:two-component system phosphate regulon sensor histidine kinase PhoR